jgi:signal transduction histidine kinase
MTRRSASDVRVRLRWRLLLSTALVPVLLALGTVWTVSVGVSGHFEESIHADLRRSSRVFEDMLSARAEALQVAAQVIVRDPRFFSILTVPAPEGDAQFRATVRGVARDFNTLTHSDLFEVLDRRGRLLASVGKSSSSPGNRSRLASSALRGHPELGILVERQGHYQATVVPVVAGGRVVGALLMGAGIGGELAHKLQSLTHSEVTFVSGRHSTGTSLSDPGDRTALLQKLLDLETSGRLRDEEQVIDVAGPHSRFLTLVKTIPGSRGGDGQLYAMQRSVDQETAFMRRVQQGLVGFGLLAILASLVVGLMVSERITRPVQSLVRGAEEMERGNYDYPLEVRSNDEIGYLAERFQEMRQHERAYIIRLEEAARLKSEFITIASHELRTPISVIKGFVELFEDDSLGPSTPEQRGAIAAIQGSLAGLVRIAEDATRISQIEGERLTLSLDEHAVRELVDQAVSMAVADGPGREVDVRSDVAAELGSVRVDGPRLIQAIAHLVRNGIRFTPDGGRVEVRARREEDVLVIHVADTGIGIPPQRIEDLFRRSLILSDSLHHHSSSVLEFNSSGLGLGLAMARGIVEAHGGTLDVASRTGQGSTFTVRVPWDCEAALDQAA